MTSPLPQTTGVLFDPNLTMGSNRELAALIARVAAETCDGQLYASTVFGLPPDKDPPEIRFCLLIDFYRSYLYRCSDESPSQEIASLVRYAQEHHTLFQDLRVAAQAATHCLTTLFSAALICHILRFANHLCSGDLLVTDMLTGEVRVSRPFPHPDVVRPATVTHLEELPQHRHFDLSACIVDRSLRAGEPIYRRDWISHDVGPVREETLHLWPGPFPSAVARAASPTPTSSAITGGKSLHAQIALSVAHCEALERFQLMYPRPDEKLFYGSAEDLKSLAIDAGPLFMGHTRRKGKTWSRSSDLYWTHAFDPTTRRALMVPAQSVWFTSRLPNESIFTPCSTSGSAIGGSRTEASIFALLELIERDAYLVMWYLRRRCRKIVPASLGSDRCRMLLLVAARDFPGYHFHLLDLRCDVPIPVVGVVATREQGQGPRTVHAAAARLGVEAAAEKGLQDVLIELANHQMVKSPRPGEANTGRSADIPKGPEDHRELYYRDDYFDRLCFFPFQTTPDLDAENIQHSSPISCESSVDLKEVLLTLVSLLSESGIQVLLKDITHPAFASAGLCCMRALAPGLFPLWFGEHPQVDLTARLRQLSISLTNNLLTDISSLNLAPHPFS